MVLTVRIPSFSAPGSGAVHRSTLRYGPGNNDSGLRDVEGVFAIRGHVSQPPLVHSGLCWRGEIWISTATIAMGSKLLPSCFMSSSTLLLYNAVAAVRINITRTLNSVSETKCNHERRLAKTQPRYSNMSMQLRNQEELIRSLCEVRGFINHSGLSGGG